MGNAGAVSSPTHRMLSMLAVYVVLLAWAFLGFYIFSIIRHEAFDSGIVSFFLSTEKSGIKFRASMLLAPFALTAIGYLINERAKLFKKTLLAENELRRRTVELENINEALTQENSMRRQAEKQLLRQAFYDSLTSLPNRALFMDRLHSSLERKKRYPDYVFAVFFLDLDRFKIINDALGHLIGDQVLIQLSQRLKKSIRSIDTLARFGGDEFAVLMEDARDIAHVNYLADRIKDEMRLPFCVFGREIYATVSIGIVLSSTSDCTRPDEFMRDADIAMYRAKALGKACHVIFDSSMHDEAATALWLETDLRRAMENNEFVLYYQPIISVNDGRITGFEALIRWQHPERGLILPLDFMTVAEETGLIIPIGQWAIHEACRQMRQWQERFPAYRHLTVSVNISSKVFSQTDFYEVIEGILRETGLEASCLRLEIVERMLIENPEPAAVLLKRLKDLNVSFDIDDFGTGYSALNYLRQFPINGLKIDRSFISSLTFDKNNAEIVKTIIALAHALDLDVIAEGIETIEQLEIFKTIKGRYAQGYFISRPMESSAAEALLTEKAAGK
jgi:diguanylate cyclase (GGDEF)-like protein